MKLAIATVALALLPCAALAHGPAVYVPAGAGNPATQPAPSPAPAPTPAPVPGGGNTLPGGTTPKHGARGGTTPGTGRGHGMGRPRVGRLKVDRMTRAMLGAVRLEWQAGFLPKNSTNGYDGSEYSIDEAVKGFGGDSAWALEDKPTLVMVYDPSRSDDMIFITNLDDDRSFVAASYYFNLIRVDVRSITDDEKKKKLKKGHQLLVYDAAGKRTNVIKGKASPNSVVKKLQKRIEADYGRSGRLAISEMESVLARKAVLKSQLKIQEGKLIDPETGRTNQRAEDRIRLFRRELKGLKNEERDLLVRHR